MNIDTPEPEVEPVLCDICNEEIKVGDKFLEVMTNLGVREYKGKRGYVKGLSNLVWDRDTTYIHLKHAIYGMVSD